MALSPLEYVGTRETSPEPHNQKRAQDNWNRVRRIWPYIREFERRKLKDGDSGSFTRDRSMLLSLVVTQSFTRGEMTGIHKALVKSLRFTRDGKTLLTSRYATTSRTGIAQHTDIFKVGIMLAFLSLWR